MTSEEIVKALRVCARTYDRPDCDKCYLYKRCTGFECIERLKREAADLIERLEKEKAALLEYAKKNAGCEQCANYRPRCDVVDCFQCVEDCPCKKCKKGSAWRWKGLDGE